MQQLVNVGAADVHALPFAAGDFDLVVAVGVLPWLHTPASAVREMARVLRDDGQVVLTADNGARLTSFTDPREILARTPLRRLYHKLRRRPGVAMSRLDFPRRIDRLVHEGGLRTLERRTVGFGPMSCSAGRCSASVGASASTNACSVWPTAACRWCSGRGGTSSCARESRNAGMRILVTGASGFIGHVACARLLQNGHEVAALVRRPGSQPAGTRAVPGDLADGRRLTEAVAGERPDCVVHLAAEIASQRSEKKIHAVNAEGTRRLIDACLAAPRGELGRGPRVVFASTVVTGDAGGAVLTEDTPLPVQTPYGRSKLAGERLVLDSGLPAVVIRPSHVYGPGGWYANELVAHLRQPGRFAVIGSGANLWDVVHVDDVAGALALAVDASATGATYHVVDDEPITFYQFMALTAAALGLGPPRRVPVALARAIAGANAVAAVVRSARSSNAKIKRELGWSPRFATAHEGVADAVGRLLAAG